MQHSDLIAALRDAKTTLVEYLGGDSAKADRMAPELLEQIEAVLRADAVARAEGACLSCGKGVQQPPTGRPRLYCNDTCKKRAQRQRKAQR
jgi:hypothetical protein